MSGGGWCNAQSVVHLGGVRRYILPFLYCEKLFRSSALLFLPLLFSLCGEGGGYFENKSRNLALLSIRHYVTKDAEGERKKRLT